MIGSIINCQRLQDGNALEDEALRLKVLLYVCLKSTVN